MAIKKLKLQNNFTTQEQSKRLLELGVPRYSADCYYGQRKAWIEPQPMIIGDSGTQYKVNTRNDIIPCWSVGRLIEIIRECATDFDVRKNLIETLVIPTTDNVDVLVRLMTADEFKSDLDFSKWED